MFRTIFTRRCADHVVRTSRVVEHRRQQLDITRNSVKKDMRSPAVAIALVGSVSLVWWLARRSTVHQRSQLVEIPPPVEADSVTDTSAVVAAPPQRNALAVVVRLTSLLLAVAKIMFALRRAGALSDAGTPSLARHQTTSMQ
jgi:hypothetical protein